MRARVQNAVKVWKRLGGSAVVVLSGAGKLEDRALHPEVSEARVMLDLILCEEGAPPRDRILLEERATNTAENALHSVALLQEMPQVARLHVVTAAWHTMRASVPFQVFAPLNWRVTMEGAVESSSTTHQDLALLSSTLADIAHLAIDKGLEKPASLLWQYALRSLLDDATTDDTIAIGYTASAHAPPVLPPRIVAAGPCTFGGTSAAVATNVAGVIITLDPLENAASACLLGQVVFAALPYDQPPSGGNPRVTYLSPLDSQRVATRIECTGAVASGSGVVVARTQTEMLTLLKCGQQP